jgi:UDP-glucose 4-epimerase
LKVLVTGATGYIGSHVCKILKEHGHYVEAWDTNIWGQYNDISAYCDYFYHYDVTKYVRGSFDAVVHLAGRSLVEPSMQTPTEYYFTNIFGTANMLDRVETDHFIFASTSSAWEMASPYARSKVAAEDVIKEKATGYTIFRFFNVSGTNGIHHQLNPPSHLIHIAALCATGKIPYINVYGTDYSTRDGTCIRDYVHVVDLANAIVKAVETGAKNTPYECLGSNRGYSVLEVLDTMERVTKTNINRIYTERRPGDAVCSVVDTLSDFITLEKTLEDMCLDQYNYERGRNG